MREGLAGGQLREGLCSCVKGLLAGSCVKVLLAGSCVKVLSLADAAGHVSLSLSCIQTKNYVKLCTRERDSTAGASKEEYLPFNRPPLLIRGDSSPQQLNSAFIQNVDARARVCACSVVRAGAGVRHNNHGCRR